MGKDNKTPFNVTDTISKFPDKWKCQPCKGTGELKILDTPAVKCERCDGTGEIHRSEIYKSMVGKLSASMDRTFKQSGSDDFDSWLRGLWER